MPTFHRSLLTIAASLLIACGGGSSEPAAEPVAATSAETQSTGGEDEVLPTPEFISMVAIQAIPEVCGDASLLRTCYPAMDGATCAQAFTIAMNACGDAMSDTLPPTVDQSSAEAVATAVATCARIAYQDGLAQAGIARTADCPLER